jgi:hypothetical protein
MVDERAMILRPTGTEILTLNPVGSLVWEALDGTLDVDGLTDRLLPEFDDVSREVLRADISGFVAELQASGLIVESSATAS